MRRMCLILAVILAVPPSGQAQKAFVYVDPVNLVELRTKCLTNPNNYSYTDPSAGTKTLAQWYALGDDTIVANILTSWAGITIYRTDVAPDEVKKGGGHRPAHHDGHRCGVVVAGGVAQRLLLRILRALALTKAGGDTVT